MKTLKKILSISAALCAITGSLLVTSCANGSSDDGNTSTVSVPKEGTLTKGQISENVVTTNASNQVVATLEDENGGTYEFTENAVTQNARAAITGSGTWVYKVNGIVKYSGTYVGDISKIGSENLSLELVVTETTNSIDEPVKVLTEKSFTIEFTETEFSTTIPLVISGVLDLRIKGGSVANKNNIYDCTQTIEWGSVTGVTYKSAHVEATVYTNGIYFKVTRPSDDCYLAGWGGTINPVEADGKKSTRLFLNYVDDTTREGFWPLCIRDKKIKLSVYMEPTNVDQYREFTYDEIFEITPAGGIGEIDYSNYDSKKWFTYGWENGKPVIKFDSSELVLPNGANLYTRISFYAGTGVWENNATIWVDVYAVPGAKYEIDLPDDFVEQLKTKVTEKGKKQIYYEHMFMFEIPGLDNHSFTTKLFPTTAVDIE